MEEGKTPPQPPGAAAPAIDLADPDVAAVLDLLPDAVLVVEGENGTVVGANAAAEELFGRPRPSLIGLAVESLVPPRYRAAHAEHIRGFFASPRARRMGAGLSLFAQRADGSEVPVDIMLRPVRAAGGDRVVAVVRDISEKIRLMQEIHRRNYQLLEMRGLEALARFAAGIAHDFNNELMVMRGYAGRIVKAAEPGSRIASEAREIAAAAGRASELAVRLLRFARDGEGETAEEPACVDDELDSLAMVLRTVLGRGIDLHVDAAAPGARIRMGAGSLARVLLNLANNARDAMPSGGSLAIRSRLHGTGERGQPVLELVVRDTGTGMDEATRGRIFERFFTTKPPDRGTGLGLSAVAELVEEAGGSIEVESEPGRGTTFTMRLPVLAAGPETA